MNEREYKRLLQQIEEEYRRKKDALELVWKMTQTTSNGASAAEAPIKRGTIDTLVRGVVQYMHEQFSPRDVMERIRQMPDVPAGLNRSSVSSALKRLADDVDGPIDVVEVGRGKRASSYRVRVATKNATPTIDQPFPDLEPEPPLEPFNEHELEPVPDDDLS